MLEKHESSLRSFITRNVSLEGDYLEIRLKEGITENFGWPGDVRWARI